MAVVTGLVGSGREDLSPFAQLHNVLPVCSNRKFVNGVSALQDAQTISQSEPKCM